MSAPESRRAFIAIGVTGLAGLMVGCPSRSRPKRSDDSKPRDPTVDSSTPPADSGGSGTVPGSDVQPPTLSESPIEICAETPRNIEGPFWVPGVPVRTEYDLYGDSGTSLTISGRVRDLACMAIPGAIVEIWHANPSGEYDNTSAEKRYRGQMAVDERGQYAFHTLMPGEYLNGPRYRPRHIHIKIWVGGKQQKTTQLYFEGDPYLAGDEFVVDGLIMPLDGTEESGWRGTFDFAINV